MRHNAYIYGRICTYAKFKRAGLLLLLLLQRQQWFFADGTLQMKMCELNRHMEKKLKKLQHIVTWV